MSPPPPDPSVPQPWRGQQAPDSTPWPERARWRPTWRVRWATRQAAAAWAARLWRALLERATTVSVAAAVVAAMLALNGAALAYGVQTVRARTGSAARAEVTLASFNELAWILSASAAGAQNYVASDDQDSLRTYTSLRARFSGMTAQARTFTIESPGVRSLFATLQPLAASEMATCARAVALEQAQQGDQARQQLTSAQYVGTVAAIGTLAPRLVAAQQRLVAGKEADVRSAEQAALVVLALAALVNLALLVAALVVLGRAMQLRQRAALEAARTEARVKLLALEESHQRMSDFLAIASHELRTPLTSTKLGIELAIRRLARFTGGGPDQIVYARELAPLREPFATAGQQLARVERLMNNLFDLTRLREGRLVGHPEPCDLVRIARERVREQRALQPGRTIALRIPPEAASLPVLADADLVGEVVTNYLTNALKYSAADRPVVVRVRRRAGEAWLCVTDKGSGLSPEARERVWERFYRAELVESASGSEVGLGLGLYISRQIIEQHGGRVGVETELSRGSTFWFTLPLAPVG